MLDSLGKQWGDGKDLEAITEDVLIVGLGDGVSEIQEI